MEMEMYTYSKQSFDTKQLLDEIKTSLSKKLFSDFEGDTSDGYCNVEDHEIELNFNDELTIEQQELLNSIVSTHTPIEDYCCAKRFKINDSFDDPSQIDYDILGLKKNRTVIKGELKTVGYYKNYEYSSNTYSDLVVTESRDYTRDPLGIVQYRTQTSNWICNDNTTGLTLHFVKYYSPEEAIQEGIDRRGNMIGFAKTALLSGLKAIYGEPTNQTYAFDLLLGVKTQMDYFLQGYTQPLKDAISASTKGYLTTGIKEAIITQLTI